MYSTYPGLFRVAYDRGDGRMVGASIATQLVTELTTAQADALNNDSETGLQPSAVPMGSSGAFALLLPSPRVLAGFQLAHRTVYHSVAAIEYTNDQTDGLGGTWTAISPLTLSLINSATPTLDSLLTYTEIPVESRVSATSFRVRYSSLTTGTSSLYQMKVHLYLEPGGGDRLAFWHPTSDEEVAPNHFNFGMLTRDSHADITFRVKNLKAEAVSGIVIRTSATAPWRSTGPDEYSFSLDGQSFGPELTVGSLAAGAASGVITARRTAAVVAPLGGSMVRIHLDIDP